MPPRGKKRTTQSSTSSTKKSSNLASKLFVEQEEKRKRQDDEILEFLESSYGNYKNNGENFDEFCDLMSNALIRKKRKHEKEIVPVLIKKLPPEIVAYSIIPFIDLESVLSGGVFLVCHAWYEDMINEERMWQELFCRLWNLTVEESNNWIRWPTEFNNNDIFLRDEIDRATPFTTKPSKLEISGNQMVKKHSYKFFKEFCLSKYLSFRKHAKIGGVKGFFLTTHQESSYADYVVIEPSLYSRYHITSVENKLKYISVTDDGDTNSTTATINITLDYYTALVPFSMKIDISYSVMHEEQESSISISACALPVANSNTQTKLILMKTGYTVVGYKEEESILNQDQENAISTFKTQWVGNTFADINEQSAHLWLFNFISTLGIDLLDEALYRMNDR